MGECLSLQPYKKVTAKSILGQNRGQLVVEYVLLIFMVVVLCALMTRLLVSRNPEDQGVIITKWSQLLEMVGQDLGD